MTKHNQDKKRNEIWSKQRIAKAVQILSQVSSVEEAANILGISSRSLRRGFSNAGMLQPASYLPYNAELSKAKKEKIVELYSEVGGDLTAQEIASKEKIPLEDVQKFIKEKKLTHKTLPTIDSTLLDSEKMKKSIEIREYKLKDKLTTIEEERIKSDAAKWQNWKHNIGNALFKLLEQSIPNYAVEKLDLEPSKPFIAVLSIQDFHLGRFASKLEVGKDTNIEIQKRHILQCVKDLIKQVAKFGRPERILLSIGGDFANSDNAKLTTTNGTPQDSLPSHTLIQVESSMLSVQLVDLLRQLADIVELIPTGGNHDKDSSVSQFLFTSAWFKDCPDVVTFFDTEGQTLAGRQYRQYGANLIAFAHGDGAKIRNMPAIIANEARELWGQTKHTTVLTGHHHFRISQDLFGMQHIQVPSMALDDRWSYSKGFQNEKGMTIVLLDKEKGYMAEIMAHSE